MKYILASMLLVSLGCLSMQQQQNTSTSAMFVSKPYKSFAEFKGDTLQYLQYNFIDREDQYQGKKLEVLFNDLELDIKYFLKGVISNDKTKSKSLAISFYDIDTYMERSIKNEKLYVLDFGLENLYSVDELDKINEAYGRSWTKHHRKFFDKQIVKSTYVVVFPDPKLPK
jgi:hypothetical protein